jgi:predicted kinase
VARVTLPVDRRSGDARPGGVRPAALRDPPIADGIRSATDSELTKVELTETNRAVGPQIVLPDPALVVLVGPAGSGKSTFAARHFAPADVLSSDAYRALIAGDERDQRVTKPAFAALHRELARRLAARRTTVVDATNVEHHARRQLLKRARAAGVPAVAIVFDLPTAVVQERNASRSGRVVDPLVVTAHLALLRRAMDAQRLEAEGFDAVHVFRYPEDVDAAVVARNGELLLSGRDAAP